jgi:hypothetical protein
MLKTLINALCCCQGSPSRSNPSNYRSPVGLDGERHLLRTGLRQGAKSRSLRSAVP